MRTNLRLLDLKIRPRLHSFCFLTSHVLKCAPYLRSEVADAGEVGGEVSADRGSSLLAVLSDLQLKLPVGCLQGAHL